MAPDLIAQGQFERVNHALNIYTPSTWETRHRTSDPDTIIYFPRAHASSESILRHTKQYQKIYPDARIVLCLTTIFDTARRSPGQKHSLLAPIVNLLRDSGTEAKTLVHLCSNGGAYMFREMASTYKAITGEKMRLDMLILESAPGLYDFWRNLFVLQDALPGFFLFYYIGTLLALMYMIAQHVKMIVSERRPLVEEVFEALNDVELVDANAQRLYLWSKTDEFLDWHDVKLHSGTARRRDGCSVQLVEFPGSRHCAHDLNDRDKYWTAIQQTWIDRQGKGHNEVLQVS